jgi:hypothetical protein
MAVRTASSQGHAPGRISPGPGPGPGRAPDITDVAKRQEHVAKSLPDPVGGFYIGGVDDER